MSVSAFGQTRRGRFSDWSGDIIFDPASLSRTRANVVVQAASLRLSPSIGTDRATGPGFLDAARYPTIRFVLLSVEPAGGDSYNARADVTIKGRTNAVSFPVDLRATGDRAHLTGAFTVNRTDFGIGTSGPWNRLVGRQATVRFALQARRT
nr:YceI family protein [Brevundimonas lenta]